LLDKVRCQPYDFEVHRPSRVVYVNRFFYPDHSATSQILTDVAVSQVERRSVLVVTSRQRYEDPGADLPARENVRGVDVVRVWTTRFGRSRLALRAIDYLTFYLSSAWALLTRVRHGDIVVLKTDPPMLSVAFTGLVRLRGGLVVNWLQDLFPEVGQGLRVRGLTGRLGRWLVGLRNHSLRRARVNVCVGTRMQELLGRQAVTNSTVIHNWADGDSIRPVDAAKNPLRSSWELTGRFVVGYSGNLGRAHDFEAILDAAERLRHRETLTFLFIGGGAGKPWLEEQVARRGLSSFLFKPYQPRSELGHSLTAPDAHLVSLKPEMEGFVVPSKFYGVAAAGRATIFLGDRQGEIARIVNEANCGVAVESHDAARLAETIESWIDDEDRVRQLGVNARAAFDRSYSMGAACAAWERLFRGLTGQPGDSPEALVGRPS
jgi:colanic acid biosynthesis glycosyl transferase WcaI